MAPRRNVRHSGSMAGYRTVLVCLILVVSACGPDVPDPVLDLPSRPTDAPGGAEIARELRGLDVATREERVYREVARGNVPGWLRELERVELTGEVDGRVRRLTFWVTPDYLAMGSDSDSFLVPLSPWMAQRIAELVGGSLPTPRMVDAVWSSARVRLIPIRIPPDERRWTVRYFERHNRLVGVQRRQHGARPGALVAGHKLDVVRLPSAVDSAGVALYGWHRSNGTPIQPVFPVPGDSRPHFSMGVRLVHGEILLDGERSELADVLADPELAPLLSSP